MSVEKHGFSRVIPIPCGTHLLEWVVQQRFVWMVSWKGKHVMAAFTRQYARDHLALLKVEAIHES